MNTIIICNNKSVSSVIAEILEDGFGIIAHHISGDPSLTNPTINLLENAELIILDLTTAKANSRLLISEIKELCPNGKIIALHIYTEKDLVDPLIQSGASAYLLVDFTRNEFSSAIRSVLNNGKYICNDVS